MKDEFVNAVCATAKFCMKPIVAFFDKVATPDLVAKKQEALELAKQGQVKDPDTEKTVQECQPNTPECRELVRRCEADLRAHTTPEDRAEDSYYSDLSSGEGGPE